tara:strand:+ start:1173 stop:2048 length:876 start_codon:yes stop_codon:yes gene_type:complete
MNLKNRLLFKLTEKLILRNQKFKGIHNGESCYVFGNAKSLKYYDLSLFNDRVSIGCNQLYLHKDFSEIKMNYYYDGDPFNFYPFLRDPYTRKIVRHVLGDLYKKKMRANTDVKYFLNVSDYPNMRGKNIFYAHHFGEQFGNYRNCSLDGVFSANQSALSGMVGMAIYLGFKDITFVGCDALLRPRSSCHFYEYGMMDAINDDKVGSLDVITAAQEFVDLRVVSPNDNHQGDLIPYIQYEELTGKTPKYKENYEIISDYDLDILSKCSYPYLIKKSEFEDYNQLQSKIFHDS